MAIQLIVKIDGETIESRRIRLRKGDAVKLTATNYSPPNPQGPAGQWVTGPQNTPLTGQTTDTLDVTMNDANDTPNLYAFKSGSETSAAVMLERSEVQVDAKVDHGLGPEAEASPFVPTPGDIVTLTAGTIRPFPRDVAGEWRKEGVPDTVGTDPQLQFTVSSTYAELGTYAFHDSLGRTSEPFTLAEGHVTVTLHATLDGDVLWPTSPSQSRSCPHTTSRFRPCGTKSLRFQSMASGTRTAQP